MKLTERQEELINTIELNKEMLGKLNYVAELFDCKVSKVWTVQSSTNYNFDYVYFEESLCQFCIRTYSSQYTVNELEKEIFNLQKAYYLAEKLNEVIYREVN